MKDVTQSGATAIGDAVAEKIAARGPSPLVLALLAGCLGMIPTGVGGLISYGNLSARLDALEARMDRTDAAAEKSLGKIETRLDAMTTKLETIQAGVLRLEGRDGGRR